MPMIKVRPTIWRCEFVSRPETKTWGWHNLAEVVECANNVLKTHFCPPLTAFELAKNYMALNECPLAGSDEDLFVWTVVYPDQDLLHLWGESPERFLNHLDSLDEEIFVPAGWSNRVLACAEKGVVFTVKWRIDIQSMGPKFAVLGYDKDHKAVNLSPILKNL